MNADHGGRSPLFAPRRMTIAIPAVLQGVIFDSLKQKMNRRDAKSETRLIAFAVAVAIILLFTAPHMVWKFMGQKRATALVKRWEAEDARGRPPGSFCPVWAVRLAGYLSSSTVRRSAKAIPSALSRTLNSHKLFSA